MNVPILNAPPNRPPEPSAQFRLICALGVLLLCTAVVPAQDGTSEGERTSAEADAARPRNVPYADVKPILESLRADLLPPPLKDASSGSKVEHLWDDWIARHDRAIRSRLALGDEDSVLNLMLFGTTFTKLQRAAERDIADMADGLPRPALIEGRIGEMIRALSSPGDNERLQFAQSVVIRKNMNPHTTAGLTEVRRWLDAGLSRMVAEYGHQAKLIHDPTTTSTSLSTLYRDRGLSSDTTMFPSFGVEQALQALESRRLLSPGAVHRVAVIGPGLDFADKRAGHDFYPQQTLQPFAVIDSLARLDLARIDEVHVTTLDISLRVNAHLVAARSAARAGHDYVVQLPRPTEPFQWTPSLLQYWQRFGDRIGTEVPALAPDDPGVRARAVRVRAGVVESVIPEELNIVVQRLEPLPPEARFDLAIATNVLIYYGVFEQLLTTANVAKMLRPGGFFLTNTPVPLLPSSAFELLGYTEVGYTNRPEGDRVFWYQRQ